MTSAGIGSSGPVKVEGKRASDGKFESVLVEAFGKKTQIPKEILAALPALSNGIQLSFEAGYKPLGGRTVYVIFLTGFTSGVTGKKAVAVSETGKTKLLD